VFCCIFLCSAVFSCVLLYYPCIVNYEVH
jgi:hypothetical protein